MERSDPLLPTPRLYDMVCLPLSSLFPYKLQNFWHSPRKTSFVKSPINTVLIMPNNFDWSHKKYRSMSFETQTLLHFLLPQNINAIIFTNEILISLESRLRALQKKRFNLNWSINLYCQCARLMLAGRSKFQGVWLISDSTLPVSASQRNFTQFSRFYLAFH
jgi:hypothetical protein